MLRNRMDLSYFVRQELHLVESFTADLPALLYVEPLAPKSTKIRNLFLCRQLFAQLACLVNRWTRRKVLQLKKLPYFNFAFAVMLRRWYLLGPFQRFLARFYVDHPVAGDELLAFNKRPIHDRPLPSGKLYPEALGRRLQTRQIHQHPGLQQLFVELSHRGDQFLARHLARFTFLACFHNHHESHDFLLEFGLRAELSGLRQPDLTFTYRSNRNI